MKTNFVKEGSEKNIEMFKMTNEELETVNGGRYDLGYDEDGNPIVIWRPGIRNGYSFSRI
jgi:hypothetical protein